MRKIGPTVRYGNTRYIFVIAIPGKKHCTVSEFDANMDINNTQQIDPVNATYYSETAEKLFSRGRLKPLRTGIEFYQKKLKIEGIKLFDNEIAHGIRPGNVIEITGPTASGIYFLIRC